MKLGLKVLLRRTFSKQRAVFLLCFLVDESSSFLLLIFFIKKMREKKYTPENVLSGHCLWRIRERKCNFVKRCKIKNNKRPQL